MLGKEFAFSLVRAVTDRGDDELNRMLGELQLAEFIYEQPAAGEVEYTFKHALTQEVAYHSVLSERRRVLHEQAGAAIEAVGAGWVEDHLPELAHHYSRSSNAGKAVEYLGRAGQRAAQQAAHREAEGYLTRALDLLPQLPGSVERDRQEQALGQTLLDMLVRTRGSGASETIAAIERLTQLAGRSGDLTQLAESLFWKCSIEASVVNWSRVSVLADQLFDLVARGRSRRTSGIAHLCRLQARVYHGELTRAEQDFAASLQFFAQWAKA